MVTLDEPRALVQQLVAKFQATGDLSSISHITFQRSQLLALRQHKLAASRDLLRGWTTKVEAAKWEAQRPATRSEVAHLALVTEREKHHRQLAKTIAELELSLTAIEAQLSNECSKKAELERRAERLREQKELAPLRARLGIYRGLGIERIEGVPEKCRVRAARKNDVHTISFEENEGNSMNNEFSKVNYLWTLLAQ